MRASSLPGSILTTAIAAAFALPPPLARAELVSTEQLVSDYGVQADREKVRAFLSRADAQREMKAMGVAPETAKQRVDALTDAEVTNLAGKIDTVPAAGRLSTTELILIVLIAILVAILI